MTPRLIISPIGQLDELRRAVTEQEWTESARFGSLQRRCEWLSWRALLHRELGEGVEVRYTEQGAPHLVGLPYHLSVSHSKRYVALALSDGPCAVDMERLDRNFARITPKYLTSEEQLLGRDQRFLAAAWCAKEAIYKYAGGGHLSFLDDIHLLAYNAEEGWLMGKIKDGEPFRLSIHSYAALDDGDYLAVTIGID